MTSEDYVNRLMNPMIESTSLVDEVYALRCRDLATVTHFQGPNLKLKQSVKEDLGSAKLDGEVLTYRDPQGRLQGIVMRWTRANPYMGGLEERCVISYDGHDNGASEWVTAQLRATHRRMGKELLMPLLPHHTEPREVLLSYADFGVDSLNLVGLTEPALRHLEDHDVCPDFAALGLTIAPLRACHIEAVIALRQAVFKRQPEACWFGATDAHIPGLRLALQEACQVQGSLHKVILEGSTVRGVLGCDVEEHALWGHSGGMDLVLAPPLQGRGLIKTGYRTLLRELAARSVNRFHGSSSQPGVLALGARMGRQFTGLSIRKATPRPQDWFRPWTKHYGST